MKEWVKQLDSQDLFLNICMEIVLVPHSKSLKKDEFDV